MATPVIVLDASAVLAFLQEEPGADVVGQALESMDCIVTAANHSEIIAKALDRGMALEAIEGVLAELGYAVEDIKAGDGLRAGAMRPQTRASGLSLGDRLCLAVATRLQAPVLTADRPWLALATGLDLDIRSLRPVAAH